MISAGEGLVALSAGDISDEFLNENYQNENFIAEYAVR